MRKILILKVCLSSAIIVVLTTLAMTTSVSRPGPAKEDLVQKPCAPMQIDQLINADGGAKGAEVRTPEEMERANREVPKFAGRIPPAPGPTEEDYWQKKAEAEAMIEKATAQDKAAALEEEKRKEKKLSDPCQGSR